MSLRISDRAIALWSPERALRRATARAKLEAFSRFWGAGGFEGARSDKRSLKSWSTRDRSADAEAIPDLKKLRSRSNDLYRNTPIATGVVKTVRTSVVGQGLSLQASIDREYLDAVLPGGLTEEQAEAWEDQAERIWNVACGQLDIRGPAPLGQHFSESCALVLASELLNGDLLVVRRFVERRGDLLGLKVQLVEAGRISTPDGMDGNPAIIAGVERDGNGAPTGYHVRNVHEDDGTLFGAASDWSRVRARNRAGELLAYLVFERERIDQTRGIPYLAPVIEPLKQLGRYSEAELAAAVISSFFTVFVKTETGEGLATQHEVTDDGSTSPENPVHDYEMGQAAIIPMRPGEEISTANPGRPNAAFDPFVQAVLRQVGVALEIPFELLVKHFTASYSAARAAMLEAWRFVRRKRHHLVVNFCQPVYGWVIAEAVARDLLDAPGFFDDPQIRQAWLRAMWTGPPAGQIDPAKETKAMIDQVDHLGIASHSEAAAELRGADYEAVVRRRAKDRRRRKQAGESDPGGRAAAAPPPETEPDMETEDVPDEEDRA